MNGAVPALIAVGAESSKTVLMKFWPVPPPTPENSGIIVPSGATRTAVSAESEVDAMLNSTVILAIWSVPPELIVSVELSVPGVVVEVAAGICTPWSVEAKLCGAMIEPSGPMIERTWPALNEPGVGVAPDAAVLTRIGRSKVTWNWLEVSFSSRLLLP